MHAGGEVDGGGGGRARTARRRSERMIRATSASSAPRSASGIAATKLHGRTERHQRSTSSRICRREARGLRSGPNRSERVEGSFQSPVHGRFSGRTSGRSHLLEPRQELAVPRQRAPSRCARTRSTSPPPGRQHAVDLGAAPGRRRTSGTPRPRTPRPSTPSASGICSAMPCSTVAPGTCSASTARISGQRIDRDQRGTCAATSSRESLPVPAARSSTCDESVSSSSCHAQSTGSRGVLRPAPLVLSAMPAKACASGSIRRAGSID